MKIPLAILVLAFMILFALELFGPRPGPGEITAPTDLPWQITLQPDGGSRVFDLELGSATLDDARAKFGRPEGLALFEPQQGPMALEAYFSDVRHGPLRAKVIVALAAGAAELEALRDRAIQRRGSPSGDWKYALDGAPAAHGSRRVKAIAYLPGTRDLDAEFFRSRFGPPAATRREAEHAVSWFYPALGLSILIDDEAGEVLEYQAPRDFALPPDATVQTPGR